MQTSERATLASLCRQAIDGQLALDELWSRVPQHPVHPVLQVIVDDLEDAVEHVPGRHGKVDWTAWIRTEPYRTLIVDHLVLQSTADLDRALHIRQAVLETLPATRSDVEAAVQEALAED